MVRWRTRQALAIGLMFIAFAAACFDDQPDLGPNDPSTLSAAAGLTIDDLPGSDWRSFDRGYAELYPTPDPEATPFVLEPELEACAALAELISTPPTPLPSLSGGHNWTFYESSDREGGRAVFATVLVFVTQDEARRTFEADLPLDEFAAFDEIDPECDRTLATLQSGVDDGSALLVRRSREVDFDIRDVDIRQVKTTLSSSAGVITTVQTSARFARGHVVASYRATESEGGSLDHERLIRAFIQRVTDAQLADRALSED